MYSLMMDQWSPKHVGIDVLKHYCDFNEVCAFVGLHCSNWIITHGMQNVKLRKDSAVLRCLKLWNVFLLNRRIWLRVWSQVRASQHKHFTQYWYHTVCCAGIFSVRTSGFTPFQSCPFTGHCLQSLPILGASRPCKLCNKIFAVTVYSISHTHCP